MRLGDQISFIVVKFQLILLIACMSLLLVLQIASSMSLSLFCTLLKKIIFNSKYLAVITNSVTLYLIRKRFPISTH